MLLRALFHKPRQYPRFYEPWYDEMDFHTDRESWCEAIADIPEEAILLFALHWLHNGGFWQFFFNSTGVMAPEAQRGFAEIGMPGTARLIGQAMDRVGSPYVFDREERMRIVGAPDSRMNFDREDRIFYCLADTRRIFRAEPKFVRHAEAYADRAKAKLKGAS